MNGLNGRQLIHQIGNKTIFFFSIYLFYYMYLSSKLAILNEILKEQIAVFFDVTVNLFSDSKFLLLHNKKSKALERIYY
jgi:hypothetical protein